jgi:hypothetical protein
MLRSVLLFVLSFALAAGAFAQGKKHSPLFKQTQDTIVVHTKAYEDSVAKKKKQSTYRRDTVYVITLPRPVKKDTAVRMASATAQQSKTLGSTPPAVPLTVNIAMRQSVVRTIYDLKISLIITNKGYRAQSFLFDAPMRASGGLWATSCTIYDANGRSVLKYPYNNTPERKTYTSTQLEKFWYTLKPKEWLMKSYDVTSLVTFEEKYNSSGKLPPGQYYLQLTFQGNPSNIVSFTMR